MASECDFEVILWFKYKNKIRNVFRDIKLSLGYNVVLTEIGVNDLDTKNLKKEQKWSLRILAIVHLPHPEQ